MTFNGEKAYESDEKIHSIVTIPDNFIQGINSLLDDRKIFTTFVRPDLPITSDKLLMVIYLDGPTLRIDTTGMDKDTIVKLRSSPAKSEKLSSEKTFTLKKISYDLTTKIENKSNEEKFAVFTPGKWVYVENWAKVTGPVVDLSVKIEKDEYKAILDKLEIKSRKYYNAKAKSDLTKHDHSEV